MQDKQSKVDTKEFEIPATTFSRDIETRVIQVIILQTLGNIEGVGLLEGNLIDTLFGRDIDRIKGIHVEQENKTHSVKVKVEINVLYGISIPEKTEEVQSKIVSEITNLTGLHVSAVHVVVKGLLPKEEKEKKGKDKIYPASLLSDDGIENVFSEEF
ncbi:MAG: Asp23/Gls24 family envelope stress response protein [Chlamydiia bacterium]|nr:Asp23/Gls24 family envelope stress response protein [Chlamydiia bacterium]